MSESTSTSDNNLFDKIRANRQNQAEQHVQQTLDTVKAINDWIDEGTIRIPDSILMQYYLPGMMSEDTEEAEYYRKKLGEHVGGIYKPFYIVDTNTSKVLFYVHGCAARVGTTNYGADHQPDSLTRLFKENINNPLMRAATVRHQVDEAAMDIGDRILSDGYGIQTFFYGWYEIFDYFGVLTPEDEAVYAPIRVKRDETNVHFFWRGEQSLSEYIKAHGTFRQRHGIVDNQTETNSDEASQRDVKETTTTTRVSDDTDTSDWD